MSSGIRVALIEDDADIRRMLVEVLRDAGHTVTPVADPRVLPRSWRGDVIVTDTFGGYRATRVARTVRSLRGRHHAAVIVCSAHAEADRDRALLGADAVVTKPFDVDGLLGTIDRVIRSVSV